MWFRALNHGRVEKKWNDSLCEASDGRRWRSERAPASDRKRAAPSRSETNLKDHWMRGRTNRKNYNKLSANRSILVFELRVARGAAVESIKWCANGSFIKCNDDNLESPRRTQSSAQFPSLSVSLSLSPFGWRFMSSSGHHMLSFYHLHIVWVTIIISSRSQLTYSMNRKQPRRKRSQTQTENEQTFL